MKKIYFKSYESLTTLETAVMGLQKEAPSDLKITVVGKFSRFRFEKNNEFQDNVDTVKRYWNELLKNDHDFGTFQNSEIGSIFIAGALAPIFLREIDGKILGTLSVGPYAILMGMGANETQAKAFISSLNNDKYLILFRGLENELVKYEDILKN